MGSFNYDNTKMVFVDEFIADQTQIRSVLDYSIQIKALPLHQQNYVALTGNYSVAGFEMTLQRKVSHYIITCYLPSGMFVMVSWISFLIPPDVVPGRSVKKRISFIIERMNKDQCAHIINHSLPTCFGEITNKGKGIISLLPNYLVLFCQFINITITSIAYWQ